MSRHFTFKLAAKSEIPIVNIRSHNNTGITIKSSFRVNPDRNNITGKKSRNEIIRFRKLDSIIETGIASIGNLAFCNSVRSLTIDGVAFDKDIEKNCQGNNPINKNKKYFGILIKKEKIAPIMII